MNFLKRLLSSFEVHTVETLLAPLNFVANELAKVEAREKAWAEEKNQRIAELQAEVANHQAQATKAAQVAANVNAIVNPTAPTPSAQQPQPSSK